MTSVSDEYLEESDRSAEQDEEEQEAGEEQDNIERPQQQDQDEDEGEEHVHEDSSSLSDIQQEQAERDFIEQQNKQSQQKQLLQKPRAVQSQMQNSGRDKDSRMDKKSSLHTTNTRARPPRQSVQIDPVEKYSEVQDPSDQYLSPGEEPSRMEQVAETGELVPYNRKQLIKEYGKMQAWRNAFVSWQAQKENYVIYQNAGFDEEKGKDRWTASHYQLYPLTSGQKFRLDNMLAKLNDLKRAAQNNDKEYKNVYTQIAKTELDLVKLKLEMYFRLYVGAVNKQTGRIDDPDDEFEKSSSADVRDMIESAEWAFQWVPKWRRIKPSVDSGSKAEKELTMIR